MRCPVPHYIVHQIRLQKRAINLNIYVIDDLGPRDEPGDDLLRFAAKQCFEGIVEFLFFILLHRPPDLLNVISHSITYVLVLENSLVLFAVFDDIICRIELSYLRSVPYISGPYIIASLYYDIIFTIKKNLRR